MNRYRAGGESSRHEYAAHTQNNTICELVAVVVVGAGESVEKPANPCPDWIFWPGVKGIPVGGGGDLLWSSPGCFHRGCRGGVAVPILGRKMSFFCGNCGEDKVRHPCGKLCGNRKNPFGILAQFGFFTACRKSFTQFGFSKYDKDFLRFFTVFNPFFHNPISEISVS